uniref:Uncharacterized protein n=1 Tax=Octopus bimaculoides TaxID=37653 RepID=A0A0L8FM72_OCTBM
MMLVSPRYPLHNLSYHFFNSIPLFFPTLSLISSRCHTTQSSSVYHTSSLQLKSSATFPSVLPAYPSPFLILTFLQPLSLSTHITANSHSHFYTYQRITLSNTI